MTLFPWMWRCTVWSLLCTRCCSRALTGPWTRRWGCLEGEFIRAVIHRVHGQYFNGASSLSICAGGRFLLCPRLHQFGHYSCDGMDGWAVLLLPRCAGCTLLGIHRGHVSWPRDMSLDLGEPLYSLAQGPATNIIYVAPTHNRSPISDHARYELFG